MRTMIVFFIALLAIPVVQVAFGPRNERTGSPILIDRSNEIITAVSKHLRARDMAYPTAPRTEAAAEAELRPSILGRANGPGGDHLPEQTGDTKAAEAEDHSEPSGCVRQARRDGQAERLI